MNQRRKLLNAARRGDTKAIGKLFELYQVRVLSGEQVAKVNKTSTYMAPVTPAKGGRSTASGHSKGTKSATAKSAKAEPKQRVKASDGKPAKTGADKKHKIKHK